MDNRDLFILLGEMNGKLDAIPKIEKHLETLNSKTATNTADIGTLKTKLSVMQWLGTSSLVAVLGALAKRFIGG
jgi:hypothetical protein